MGKKIVIGVVVLLAILATAIASAPSSFRIERSTRVVAPSRAVYERLTDFHRWSEWSPWAHVDPEMKQSFEGAPSGAGAGYTWSSKSRVGAGKMVIVEARPDERVAIRMDLTSPLESTSTMELAISPDFGGVRVVWTMYGQRDFVGKGAALLARLDAMLGRDFENGLAALKKVAEAQAAGSDVARR